MARTIPQCSLPNCHRPAPGDHGALTLNGVQLTCSEEHAEIAAQRMP